MYNAQTDAITLGNCYVLVYVATSEGLAILLVRKIHSLA